MAFINLLGVLLVLYGIMGPFLALINTRNFQPSAGDRESALVQRIRRIHLPFYLPGLLLGGLSLFLTSFIIRVDAQDVGVMVTPRYVGDGQGVILNLPKSE